jgi:peptidoglycan/xylan/chitin deacetylase (PgdA/CDA1 family)
MNELRTGYRRWLASPVLATSAAVHAGAAAALLMQPRAWPWALGSVAANHGVLTAAGLWPKSRLLGPNWIRLPQASSARGEIAITIDDGPDPEVTPQVLEQLEEQRAQATFFCVGEQVERHASLAREIVRRGHSIENHSQRHRHNFSLLGPAAMRSEIARAQDSISSATGCTPQFFRAPAGLRNPFLDPVLAGLNLRLATWTRRGFDTVNGNPDSVYQRLTDRLSGGDILLLHDGHAALGSTGRPVVLEVLPRLLRTIRAGGFTPVTLRAALL